MLYQHCDTRGGFVFFCLPQSHRVTFCFMLNHWDEKRVFLWISTGCSPRKYWLNSHLGSSKLITSPLICLESNSLAEGQCNLQVSFLCSLMKWSWYPSLLLSLRIIYPNTQNTLIFFYWVLYENLEAKANHTWGKQVGNGLYESNSMCSIG